MTNRGKRNVLSGFLACPPGKEKSSQQLFRPLGRRGRALYSPCRMMKELVTIRWLACAAAKALLLDL